MIPLFTIVSGKSIDHLHCWTSERCYVGFQIWFEVYRSFYENMYRLACGFYCDQVRTVANGHVHQRMWWGIQDNDENGWDLFLPIRSLVLTSLSLLSMTMDPNEFGRIHSQTIWYSFRCSNQHHILRIRPMTNLWKKFWNFNAVLQILSWFDIHAKNTIFTGYQSENQLPIAMFQDCNKYIEIQFCWAEFEDLLIIFIVYCE